MAKLESNKMEGILMNQFSHNYYNNLWSKAQAEFRGILNTEKCLKGIGREIPQKLQHRQQFLESITETYFQYLSVYKKFDEIYDQMLHPQKRPLVRLVLDLTLARLLEIKEVMVGTELSEFIYCEDVLNILKYYPEDTDLPIPKYFQHEKSPEAELRKRLLEKVIQEKEEEKEKQAKSIQDEKMASYKEDYKEQFWQGNGEVVDDDDDEDNGSIIADPKQFIIVLQIVERQRQGLFTFGKCQFEFDESVREEARIQRAKELEGVDLDQAAVVIQKIVRGFLARKKALHFREKELIFLGLKEGPYKDSDARTIARVKNKEITQIIETEKESRRNLQRKYSAAYKKAESYYESKIKILEAAEMTERLKYSMRNWLLEIHQVKKKLPDLPKAEDFEAANVEPSSSQLYFDIAKSSVDEKNETGKSDDNIIKKKKADASSGAAAGKEKKKKKQEKDKLKERKAKKGLVPTKLDPPEHLDSMITANLAYNKNWRLRNELNNEGQMHDETMIVEEKRKIIAKEVREQVDQLMKAELQHLKHVLELKKKKKAKKGKKGRKGRKGRRGKGRKKKKKKKPKDLTPDRTPESLFEELVHEGIIKKYPEIRFNNLVGTSSLVNESIRKYYIEHPIYSEDPTGLVAGLAGGDDTAPTPTSTTNINVGIEDEKMPLGPNPPPTFGDIKIALKDICVLPLGSETVHQLAPSTKSLFIAGPNGSGKKSLVYAICTELDATLFDFSPRNLVGKYEGKHGLIMLFHLLDKVGRWCQPTIIMVDMAEMAYMKRVPKTEQSEPKRIKKQLSKFIKMLSSVDRMMLIGLSSEPWNAKFQPMKKDYQKFLYIPKPNYGDRLEMWKQQLKEHLAEFNSKMSLEVLAKLTDCWTLGDIKQCAERTLGIYYKTIKAELDEHQKPFQFDPEEYLEGALPFKPVRIGRRYLDMNDFLEDLIYIDPIFIEQDKAWINWYCKTPLQKLRLKSQLPPEDEVQKKKKKRKGKGIMNSSPKGKTKQKKGKISARKKAKR